MQPQRERVKLGKDRNWWRVLPVVAALGLIGLMLVLTLMPSAVDDAQFEPSDVALVGSPTPSSEPRATLSAAPFPTKLPEPPSIDLLPAGPGEVKLATALPASTTTVGPTSPPNEPVLLPTIVPVIDPATATVPVATIVAQTSTPMPTSTARPSQTGQSHIYALIARADLEQHQLVRVETTGLVTIATVDDYAERVMALLPEQQTLLIPRNQNLVAIDLTTGQTRWSHQLMPKNERDYESMLTVDYAGTGVYLLDRDSLAQHWSWSHIAIQDGVMLETSQAVSVQGHSLRVSGDGKIWLIEADKLYQFDPVTSAKRDFGALSHNQIIGDGRQPLLGVFRAPSTVSLIDRATGNEQQVRLNPPFQGTMISANLSHDQSILVVESIVSNDDPRADDSYLNSVYNLQTGNLIGIDEAGDFSSMYPGINADQWLVDTFDWDSGQNLVTRWNVATNRLTEVVAATVWADHGLAWLGEVAGPAINLTNTEFQAAVTPLPTEVPSFEQPSLPTILPPSIQPVAIFGDFRVTSLQLQRLASDASLEVIAEQGMTLFPRYNQPPLMLQRPQSKTWQLVDVVTQETAAWQFEKLLSGFMSLLAPNDQSLLAIAEQDLRTNDLFTGATQLAQINTQTGDWNVLADSRTWPELKWAKPIAWQGDTVYFLQTSKNPHILWRAQLGPPFQAEQIAEIPSIVANVPDVDTAILTRFYVSPNQRWLVYPLAAANKTMVLRVLDVVNQRSHDIALPLMELNDLSFSPEGNSFAFMLPNSDRGKSPALYQLEHQRWYQLDSKVYTVSGESPFLWSPDGHWLAIDFSHIGGESQFNVYNAQQPSLAFRSNFDSTKEPLALYNDGKTILARHFWQSSLEQQTWNDQQWQINWRIDAPISHSEHIYYLYPR